ncbi:transcriptional initiation protein Tat [Halobellus sp. GM3]|uniref:transcriptional initiation protein Tat n=1 Tax=Halobellus sp. GM3 TaxID=3458410 RepID=UPI00403DF39B
MKRRTALRVVAGATVSSLAGCLGSLPRATGPRNPPAAPADQPRRTPDRPDLAVGTFDFEAAEDGSLRVFGTVENRGDVRRTAAVRVTARVGGEAFSRETDVAVGPGATVEWSVTLDAASDAFTSGGDLNVDLV